MKFLVYSSTNSDTIKSSLGAVDYSYYFVLESYLPLLRQFGEVEVLDKPLTDKEASHYQSLEDCYYLSFTPPNRVQLNHSIPVIPVFAWEFGTLPDTAFVSAADNWKYVLEQTGQAITHSQYAAKVVRNAVGNSYPVASIPAPIWDGFDRVRQQRHQARLYLDQLTIRATVIDSRDFDVSNGNPIPLKRPDLVRRRVIGKLWDGEELDLDCAEGTRLPPFSGFAMRPDGKFWSEAECPWMILPGYLSGPLVLHIELESNEITSGQPLKIQFGNCSALVRISEFASVHRLILDVQEAVNILHFSFPGPGDPDGDQSFCVRTLSIKKFETDTRDLSVSSELVCDQSVQWRGVHAIEPWGRWTAQEESDVVLPLSISGDVMVSFTIVQSMMATGETFDVQLGHQVVTVLLSGLPQDVNLPFMNVACTDSLQIKRLGASSHVNSEDERLLGLGLSKLTATSWPLDLVSDKLMSKKGEELDLDCSAGTRLPPFSGFVKRADGKFWSEAECPWLILPGYFSGMLVLHIELESNGIMPGQMLKLQFGNCSPLIRVSEVASEHRLILDVKEAVSILHFSFPESTGPDGDQSFCVHALSIKEFDAGISGVSDGSELLCDQSLQWYGVHDIEPWGRWTAQEESGVVLPFSVSGDVMVGFTIVNSLVATGEVFDVQLGDQVVTVLLSDLPQDVELPFVNVDCTDNLQIKRLGAKSPEGAEDDRLLGLALSKVTLTSQPSDPTPVLTSVATTILQPSSMTLRSIGRMEEAARKQSVVYTTVFNPIDGRKNWPDIIKAFVFALRDKPRAVLIVKITHNELQPFLADICSYFVSLAPFKCRIVFVHGYIESGEYDDLIRATSFIVNASRGEGQCLPLMEFMSSGVPAIAPDNTAMSDYVNVENSFVVKSTIEPAVWPQDPRLLLKTTRYRINWESLYAAYMDSYHVAVSKKRRYARMSLASVDALQQYCSLETTGSRFADFLAEIGRDGEG